MLVKPEIRRPRISRERRIATSSLGSLGDFLFKYIMRKIRHGPDSRLIWLSVGTPRRRLQALASGRWMPPICPIHRTRGA